MLRDLSLILSILRCSLPRLKTATSTKNDFLVQYYDFKTPKSRYSYFSSGKGGNNWRKKSEDFVRGLDILIQKMKEAGVICHDTPDVAVTNMVCSYDLGKYINLNKVVITLNLENIEYEPEQFPGLVYRISDPKVVALLFSSGKIILTGGKTMEDVERGVAFLEQNVR